MKWFSLVFTHKNQPPSQVSTYIKLICRRKIKTLGNQYFLNPGQFLGFCHHMPCNMTLLIHILCPASCSCVGNIQILNTSIALSANLPDRRSVLDPVTAYPKHAHLAQVPCVPSYINPPHSSPWLYIKAFCSSSCTDLSPLCLICTQ